METEILPTCRDLGIGFVAYSPLGRGFLTGRIRSLRDIDNGDSRRGYFPRFSEKNLRRNLGIIQGLEAVAADKGCSLSHWRWPGCWIGAMMSSPSPGPNAFAIWRKTSGPWRSG